MSKHDLKADKLQVESLDNRVQEFIEALVAIRMASADIDLSNPLSLITKGYLDSVTGNGIPLIALWDGSSTPINYYRSHPIGGIEYLFRSLFNDNTTEPTLDAGNIITPWIQQSGPVTNWDAGTTYDIDQVVINPYFSATWMYKSATAGNIGNDPVDGDDAYWIRVGAYAGVFGDKDFYTNDEAVVDANLVGWKSAVSNNSYELSDLAAPWRKSSEVPNTGIPSWSFVTLYLKNDYATIEVNDGGNLFTYVYQALQNTTGDMPVGGQYDLFWRYVGVYKEAYVADTVYGNADVVYSEVDGITNVYISNKADNSSALFTSGGEGKWKLIGPLPGADINKLTFTQADLVLVYEGNYSLSFDVPDGKSIASIETKAGTATRRIDVSQAVTDTANSPNTIISGFDNNAAQTITIKLI